MSYRDDLDRRGHETGGAAAPRSAVDEMVRVLDVGPALAADVLAANARLTRRWKHGAIHDRTAPMIDHVIMTYYGEAQRIEWRDDKRRVESTTRRGAITVIPSLHEARWDVHGAIEVSHVYVPDDRLRACAEALSGAARPELIERVGFDDPIASRLLEILALEADRRDGADRLFTERALDLLCLQLLRDHTAQPPRIAPPPRRGLAPWQVRRVTDYLHSRLDASVGLDELAALVGLSRFHFCTAFREATGLPPHRWLIQRRVACAQQMLRDPAIPITQIALAVGYGSSSAFTAMFRRATGMTPMAYRRGR